MMMTSDLTFDMLGNIASTDDMLELSVMLNSSMEKPWIVNTMLYYLSDLNPNFSMYEPEIVINLLKFLIDYYNSSWSAFFDISSGDINLEKLIEYHTQHLYKVEAANGWRIATQNEVNEGIFQISGSHVIELKDEPKLKLEESEYKFINLFTWTVTGRWRYFKKSGLEIKFNSENKPTEPDIRYISRNLRVLNRMCELLKTDYYSSVISKLKDIRKAGNYKYLAYADDEIQVEDKIGFVVNQVAKLMPKNKSPILYECSKILYKNKSKLISSYTVEEKITLRKGYYELKYPDIKLNDDKLDFETMDEIKSLCDRIRQGVGDGLLSDRDFSVKIVTTLTRSGYRRCSDKQKSVLISAIRRIEAVENTRKQVEVENPVETNSTEEPAGFSLANMSDLLGRGMLSI